MSKQKRPDTYKEEIPEIPKTKAKKAKSPPKKKKTAPKSYICPFCNTKFTIPKRRRFLYNFPADWKCIQCGGRPWGYKELIEEDRKFLWRSMYRWVPLYCTFCGTSGYDFCSKEHYFRLWTNDAGELYCDFCKFKGEIGGGIKR